MRRAFSLVELSIVLVILGLLVGGVLAGKSLIHAATLRDMSADAAKYRTAYFAFRDKYFGIPGDITNATGFWGIADGTGDDSTCWNAAGAGTATCNGDGNGQIGATNGENFRFWKHLSNAGLVEGNFTGVSSALDSTKFGGFNEQNTPTGLNSTFWGPTTLVSSSASTSYFDGTYGNLLQLGGYRTMTASNYTPKITPQDMWNIDTKLDDGKPASGKWRTRLVANSVACTDAANSADLDADYDFDDAAKLCTGMYLL